MQVRPSQQLACRGRWPIATARALLLTTFVLLAAEGTGGCDV